MKTTMLIRRGIATWRLVAALTVGGAIALAHHSYADPVFESSNVISDIQGVARDADAALTNPWGLTTGPEGDLHLADDQSGGSTLYTTGGLLVGGTDAPEGEPHVIAIPAATGTGTGTPTGIVVNEKAILLTDTTDFVVSSGTLSGVARYIYATKDGAIAGYNERVNANAAVLPSTANLSSSGAGFTGLTLVQVTATSGSATTVAPRLIAANFAQNKIVVFDGTFAPVTLTGTVNTFVDPNPPTVPAAVSGTAVWSPFNVQEVDYSGKVNAKTATIQLVVVTYALHTGTTGLDEVDSQGYGYVALFTPEGQYIERLVDKGGLLNAPWGVALAHKRIAKYPATMELLIGNHGDGQINVYDFVPPTLPVSGTSAGALAMSLGTLKNGEGVPLAFDGLWGLHFGPAKLSARQEAQGEDSLQEDDHNLYFSAGLLDETHGLLGRISVP